MLSLPSLMIEKLDDTVYLLTPFIDGGEMFAWVIQENNRFGRRRMETVRKLFRQLAEGMKVSTAWSARLRSEIDA